MYLSRLTLSWEDGICIVSSYSVLLLVIWSPCCYLNVWMINYFCIILNYSQLFLIIPKLLWNNSRIASAIKIPKIIPTWFPQAKAGIVQILLKCSRFYPFFGKKTDLNYNKSLCRNKILYILSQLKMVQVVKLHKLILKQDTCFGKVGNNTEMSMNTSCSGPC